MIALEAQDGKGNQSDHLLVPSCLPGLACGIYGDLCLGLDRYLHCMDLALNVLTRGHNQQLTPRLVGRTRQHQSRGAVYLSFHLEKLPYFLYTLLFKLKYLSDVFFNWLLALKTSLTLQNYGALSFRPELNFLGLSSTQAPGQVRGGKTITRGGLF